MLLRSFILSLALCAAWSQVGASDVQLNRPVDPQLDRLRSFVTGSFSSTEQSQADSSFIDIHLHIVPLWSDRTDGPWLYVEQAASTELEKPYRQRIYRLRRVNDSTVESTVYAFSEPLRFAQAWKTATPLVPFKLGDLTPDSLIERTGCSILLRPSGDTLFWGSTDGANCTSDLRGAAYATSEVRISRTGLTSWDRGFDSIGVQVWGSTNGPYKFVKMISIDDSSFDELDTDKE